MEKFYSNLRSASLGLILAVCTVLYGQGLGIAFGVNEDAIKERLNASAILVKDTVYNSDEALIKPVLSKSWNYMIRAHLHAGGMGTTALVLIILVCFVGSSQVLVRLSSFGLGFGGLGYSIFWMWAGFRAPGLGSTSAAKESLKLLAMPSSGMFVLATLIVLIHVINFTLRRNAN
jgi:hypothetical protein